MEQTTKVRTSLPMQDRSWRRRMARARSHIAAREVVVEVRWGRSTSSSVADGQEALNYVQGS